MKLYFSLVLCIFTFQFAFALDLDARREKIIQIIDEELSEIQRMSSQSGNRNPDYLFRMAELNFEKGRLWKDKENQQFLSLSTQKRSRINKKSFFKNSQKFFNKAIVLCRKIVKSFPNYKNISDVYYILGYDAKENNKTNTASNYLNKAISKSQSSRSTKVKAQIALAENFYNKKQYSKAIPLYEKALRSNNDRWWTKDSYNLGWSYYRSKKYTLAINKLKEVYAKSSSSNYVDMREQVQRDIGLFYATSGRVEEGIKFYEKLGIDFSKELIKIAVQLKSEGKYTEANNVLNYAEKYLKNSPEITSVYLEQILLYEKYGKVDKHLYVSKKMFKLFEKNKLNTQQISKLRYQVGKMGAYLQKKIATKSYQARKQLRRKTANEVNEYFKMMTRLSNDKAAEYYYLQAETSFADDNYTDAIKQYNQAFEVSIKQKNNKFAKRSIDGMLACLTQKTLSKSIKEDYYIPVYEKFLKVEPKGKKAYSVYQKLFKIYYERSRFDKAEEVLNKFKDHYPQSYGIHEAMIAELMEVSRKRNDHGKIRSWIKKIDLGEYKVSAKFRNKLQQLLTTIQIESVQKSLNRGDKKSALVGYHQILKDPNSTKKSKINAKYNLAALYYELGAVNESYQWAINALNEMNAKDIKNFADSFLAMSNFLFGNLYYDQSAQISMVVMNRLCSEKTSRKDVAFKNSAFIYLADKKLDKVVELLKMARKCKVKTKYLYDVQFELLKEYALEKLWTDYELLCEKMSFQKDNWPRLIFYYHELMNVNKAFGNTNRVKELKIKRDRFYSYSIKNKKYIPVESLDIMAYERINILNSMVERLRSIKLAFPDKIFNKLVVQKLELLSKIEKEVSLISDIGSGRAIIKSSNVLINSYLHLGNELKDFIPDKQYLPKGSEKQYLDGFKKAMIGNYEPLLLKAKKIREQTMDTMNKYNILSYDNYELVQNSKSIIRYWSPYLGVTMDKGGRR